MNRTTTTHQERQWRQDQQVPQSSANASGCLLRVYWMLLGNAIVALAAYQIVQSEVVLTSADLVYWLVVASLIGARYVDIRSLHGCTAEGQPATLGHWRRYSLRVLGISVFVWFAAHCLGYFV